MVVGIDTLKAWPSLFMFCLKIIFLIIYFLLLSLKPLLECSIQFVLSKEVNMKTFKIMNAKRLQFLEWWKTMASTRSAVTLGNVQRRMPTVCCCKCKSHVLRQLLWKFKSMRKQALGWKGINTQFSYDIHSYSLNFDDGFSRH